MGRLEAMLTEGYRWQKKYIQSKKRGVISERLKIEADEE